MRILILACVLACSSGPRDLSDLSTPWYATGDSGVDTSSGIALDAAGNVWRFDATPVRSDLSFVNTATPAQRIAVAAAFGQLPLSPAAACVYFFERRYLSEGVSKDEIRSWAVCADENGVAIEPYATAVKALTDISSP